MALEHQYVTREECLQHRQAIRDEIDRRDAERREDLQELRAWMVRIETSVNGLPEAFQARIDRKFDRLYQAIVCLILAIISAAILSWIGLSGG